MRSDARVGAGQQIIGSGFLFAGLQGTTAYKGQTTEQTAKVESLSFQAVTQAAAPA